MIKSVKIKCPLCGEESQLYLSINPAVIILKCPECWTPLMYTKTEIRILSEHELKTIAAPSAQSVFNSIFDKVSNKKNMMDHYANFKDPMRISRKEYTNSLMLKKSGTMIRNNISPDDIIDLHNELAECDDVQQFIEKV